jgi:hypothetical protein
LRRTSALEIREVLDAAVRAIAVNTGSLQERLDVGSRIVLGRLAGWDFAEQEERELFEQIEVALGRSRPRPGLGVLATTLSRMSDLAAEQVASDILDLRDMAMGRAIREARARPPKASRSAAGARGRRAGDRYRRRR